MEHTAPLGGGKDRAKEHKPLVENAEENNNSIDDVIMHRRLRAHEATKAGDDSILSVSRTRKRKRLLRLKLTVGANLLPTQEQKKITARNSL